MVFVFMFSPVLSVVNVVSAQEANAHASEEAGAENHGKNEDKSKPDQAQDDSDDAAQDIVTLPAEEDQAPEDSDAESFSVQTSFAAPSPAFSSLDIALMCPSETATDFTWTVYNSNEAPITYDWDDFVDGSGTEVIAPGETDSFVVAKQTPITTNKFKVSSAQTHQTTVSTYNNSINNCVPADTENTEDTTAPDMPVHLSKPDNSVLTSAEADKLDWTDVSDDSEPVTYRYESSMSNVVNVNGSFASPVYQSGVLTESEIPTTGTPEGVYYWHVKAVDAVGNESSWTTPWKITVDNTAPVVPDTVAPVVSIGTGNGNTPDNTGPAHNATVSGTTTVYATIQDDHLAGYHFRIVKQGGNEGHSCGADLGLPENQGFGGCGYAYNLVVSTSTNTTNGIIAQIDTKQLENGVYEFVLGAVDEAGNRTDGNYLNDPKVLVTVSNFPDEGNEGEDEPTPTQTTMVVTPSAMQGWVFATESGVATGTLVTGPATVPAGTGSAQFTTTGTADGELLYSPTFLGTALADIHQLKYSTYRQAGDNALAVALQFNIDVDSTDANNGWQGRLVYEPYYTHEVAQGEWQEWNTMDNSGSGNWWFSGAPGNATCSMANPCTWSEVIAAFPHARIHPTLGAINFKAGSGWNAFTGNVDKLIITVTDDTTTVDFEPDQATTSSDTEDNNDTSRHHRRSGTRHGNGSVLGISFGDEGGQVLGESFCAASVTSYIKQGANNDVDDVKMLQEFLNKEMNLKLDVSGVYDAETFEAVKAFQLKYADKILKPWGLTEPTGYVFKLTRWWMNALICGNTDTAAMPQI